MSLPRAILFSVLLLPAFLPKKATAELGAPSFDTASETTYRKVRWTDFKGDAKSPPGWNRWSEGTFAHISVGLRLGHYDFVDRADGNGWISVAAGIRPYAVMDKFHSAFKHGSRNDTTLAHEQLHFDVAEAFARELAVELAAFEGRGMNAAEARVELDKKIRTRFEKVPEELFALQSSYDRETRNGQVKRQQKKWAAKIEQRLDDATEALSAVLENAEVGVPD